MKPKRKYRYLDPDEIIQDGDEFTYHPGKRPGWVKAPTLYGFVHVGAILAWARESSGAGDELQVRRAI